MKSHLAAGVERVVAMLLLAGAGALPGGTNAAEVEAQANVSGPTSDELETQCLPLSCDDELEEIVVLGQRPVRNRELLAVWLRRLGGRFSNTGSLELLGRALPVRGMTECVGIGEGPGMHCLIMLEAKDVDTHLKPGAFMLGIDLEAPLIRYTSIDDKGIAVGTTGELRGDTVLLVTPCRSALARECVTHTRITASRGSEHVRFQVEVQMDGRVASRYDIDQVRLTEAGR